MINKHVVAPAAGQGREPEGWVEDEARDDDEFGRDELEDLFGDDDDNAAPQRQVQVMHVLCSRL